MGQQPFTVGALNQLFSTHQFPIAGSCCRGQQAFGPAAVSWRVVSLPRKLYNVLVTIEAKDFPLEGKVLCLKRAPAGFSAYAAETPFQEGDKHQVLVSDVPPCDYRFAIEDNSQATASNG